MLNTSHNWQSLRRNIWQTYQHWRNLRVQMLLIEHKTWTPELEFRIETELIPLLERGYMPDIKAKITELTKERIKEKYK